MMLSNLKQHLVYVLVHFILIVVGGLLALLDHDWAEPVGLSLLAAGIAGYVVFVYVLVSRDLADRIDVLQEFGISYAFQSRATKIEHEYRRRTSVARDRIDILAFGLSALREDFGEEMSEWKRRVRVRILLIDPAFPTGEYSYSDQRDREEEEVVGAIRQDVEKFVDYTKSLFDARFQVRLYMCLPTINIFRVDHEIFWGPYLVRREGRNTPTFLAKKGIMFDVLHEHFKRIWEDERLSRPVPEEWLKTPVDE